VTVAEKCLIDAVGTGQVCDFSNGQITDSSDGSPIDLAARADDRTIDAVLLRRLLLNDYPGINVQHVDLWGAVIVGDLNIKDTTLTPCSLKYW